MVCGMQHTDVTAATAGELRGALGKADMSGHEMARQMGESPTWVHRRLKGKTEISIGELARFADVLGVPLVSLLPQDSA